MYYGGDIAELLLAAALVATWRPTAVPASPRLCRPPTAYRLPATAQHGRNHQRTTYAVASRW